LAQDVQRHIDYHDRKGADVAYYIRHIIDVLGIFGLVLNPMGIMVILAVRYRERRNLQPVLETK